jgi:uncharacterized membrane protein
MSFRTICTLGFWVTFLFGLSFVLFPAPLLALYGIAPVDAPLALMSRYFGSALLAYAAAIWGLRRMDSPVLQLAAAPWLAVSQLAGLLVSLQCVLAGTVNALGWSSVLIYGFFAVAWARLSRVAATAQSA